MAPSHVTDWLLPLSLSRVCFKHIRWLKLEEMVGKGKAEEELERVAIAGPSREVVECSSGNIFPFFSLTFLKQIIPPITLLDY